MTGRTVEHRIEREALRTPRAAGIAGIVFAILLSVSLVLLSIGTPSNPDDVAAWVEDGGRRTAVVLALQLIPFAGIAFLWFIGVLRSRVGEREDRFLASVLIGSGLLFVAMLFVSAAIAGGLYATVDTVDLETAQDVWTFGRSTTQLITSVYALRMAAVFIISTTTLASKLSVIPRWLTLFGYTSAIVLLLTSGTVRWVELVFPLWVLLVSIHLLRVADQPAATPA